MKRSLPFLLLLIFACADAGFATTTTVAATTTITLDPTTTAPPLECPPPPYELGSLPVGVGTAVLDATDIEPDVWT
ncbi:MAG TPA: hypothetical protein VHM29_01650, partial [Acidimicrobiia bacterium]|nr:hypothetical protein [Acidimicrobiia bacterium]